MSNRSIKIYEMRRLELGSCHHKEIQGGPLHALEDQRHLALSRIHKGPVEADLMRKPSYII